MLKAGAIAVYQKSMATEELYSAIKKASECVTVEASPRRRAQEGHLVPEMHNRVGAR